MMLHAPRVASWVDRMNKSTVNEWRPGVSDESLLPTYGPDGLLPNDKISCRGMMAIVATEAIASLMISQLISDGSPEHEQ